MDKQVNPNIHVEPVDNLIEHTTDEMECACNPKIQWIDDAECFLIIHNAYDGREYHKPDSDKVLS